MIRRFSERASVFAKNSFLRSSLFHGESLDSSVSPVLIPGVHVFHSQDAVGIVAKLSDCIAAKGGNILGYDVFVPENKNVFYSRSEFIFDPVKWPRNQVDEDFHTIAQTYGAMNSVVRVPSIDPKYKIALLFSKQDHCLVEMLHRWQDGKLPVDITCVISNHERAPNTHVMRFLERHGIPYHYVSTTKDNKREDDILELVKDTDFLVLARYMQILSGNFLKGYGKDVINIHHGLLPSFKGGNPAKQAFDAGVKLIGATSHFVTEELDSGPIIEQMVESVSHRDNLRSFVQKSEDLEKKCLTKAIKSYCELRESLSHTITESQRFQRAFGSLEASYFPDITLNSSNPSLLLNLTLALELQKTLSCFQTKIDFFGIFPLFPVRPCRYLLADSINNAFVLLGECPSNVFAFEFDHDLRLLVDIDTNSLYSLHSCNS